MSICVMISLCACGAKSDAAGGQTAQSEVKGAGKDAANGSGDISREDVKTGDNGGDNAAAAGNGTNDGAAGAGNAAAQADGFAFVSDGVVISMNQDTAEFLDKLGEPLNYAESPSCAFEGLDKIYTYDSFDLYTYPDGDHDFVNSIYFTSDKARTPLGIGLGSSVDEMEAAYGTDYEEEFEVYTYTKDKTKLAFLTTDGVIDSIEYTAITE